MCIDTLLAIMTRTTREDTMVFKPVLPMMTPVQSTGIAMFIGCNYTGSDNALYGCYNDANKLATYARSQAIFTDVRLYVSDDHTGSYLLSEIREAILEEPDVLWISFSGHGGTMVDDDDDEADGKDESIFLGNKDTLNVRDDELLDLVKSASGKTRILFTSDSCHSGSILDLPYVHRCMEDEIETSVDDQGDLLGGRIVCISAARDSEFAYENANDQSGVSSGAFTSVLCSYLRNRELETVPITELIRTLGTAFRHGKQTPVVSTSYPIITGRSVVST